MSLTKTVKVEFFSRKKQKKKTVLQWNEMIMAFDSVALTRGIKFGLLDCSSIKQRQIECF